MVYIKDYFRFWKEVFQELSTTRFGKAYLVYCGMLLIFSVCQFL